MLVSRFKKNIINLCAGCPDPLFRAGPTHARLWHAKGPSREPATWQGLTRWVSSKPAQIATRTGIVQIFQLADSCLSSIGLAVELAPAALQMRSPRKHFTILSLKRNIYHVASCGSLRRNKHSEI